MSMLVFELDVYLDTYIINNGIPVLCSEYHPIDDSSSKENDDDENDETLIRDFKEDLCITKVEISKIKRYQAVVKFLKKRCDYRCQICGYTFQMDNGKHYCEAHHIKELSEGGSQNPSNVLILCPNHHRQFHYARQRIEIYPPSCGVIKIIIDDQEYSIKTSLDLPITDFKDE